MGILSARNQSEKASLYVSNYTTFWHKYEDNKKISGCQELWGEVGGDEVGGEAQKMFRALEILYMML